MGKRLGSYQYYYDLDEDKIRKMGKFFFFSKTMDFSMIWGDFGKKKRLSYLAVLKSALMDITIAV